MLRLWLGRSKGKHHTVYPIPVLSDEFPLPNRTLKSCEVAILAKKVDETDSSTYWLATSGYNRIIQLIYINYQSRTIERFIPS